MNGQRDKEQQPQVELHPVARGEIAEIVHMAESVWRHHFPGIISDEQIDYMLSRLYSLKAITREYMHDEVSYRFIVNRNRRVGFCAFGTEHGGVMKLHKLYVLPQFQRRGFGKEALSRIEEQCRKQNCSTAVLAVNKNNRGAIKAYESDGFKIREAVTVDIGGGFVMDDYIMEKRLS
jgi:ribosomal protein S18 acetylase RimI-like enzyme